MRTLLRVSVPVEAGNKAFREGTLQKIFMEALDRLKPEAAYFLPECGVRTAIMFINLKDTSDMPAIAEPFFEALNARVEFLPVMNADDLKKGIEKVR